MSRCTGVWSEVMSGCTGVWSEGMSPGGREMAPSGREREDTGPGLLTLPPPPPPPLKERLPDVPEPPTRGTAGRSRGRDGGARPRGKGSQGGWGGAGGTDQGGSSQSGGQGGAGCLAGSQGGPSRTGARSEERGRRRQGLLASRGLWNGLLAESELLDGPQAMWDRGSSSPPPPPPAKLNNANNCK